MSTTAGTVLTTLLVKWLIRLGRQVNKTAFHNYADKLKKRDVEEGHEDYKNG
jgi:hypothetical protein